MFQLAADYERKARAAEALEASWRDRYNEDAPVAPKETDAVGEQSARVIAALRTVRHLTFAHIWRGLFVTRRSLHAPGTARSLSSG